MFLHAVKPFPMSTFRMGLMHGRSFLVLCKSLFEPVSSRTWTRTRLVELKVKNLAGFDS
jgi:hypothetical protein